MKKEDIQTGTDSSSELVALERLAELGDCDAQCYLGEHYAIGDGVTQDYEKAVYFQLFLEIPYSARSLKFIETNTKYI